MIGENEYWIGFFNPYVVSPPLSMTRASYQTLIMHRPNPSRARIACIFTFHNENLVIRSNIGISNLIVVIAEIKRDALIHDDVFSTETELEFAGIAGPVH